MFSTGVVLKWLIPSEDTYIILKCFHHFINMNICGRIFYLHFGALWDECSDVDSRRHQSRGPQQAASTRLKSGVVKPFDLNSSFSQQCHTVRKKVEKYQNEKYALCMRIIFCTITTSIPFSLCICPFKNHPPFENISKNITANPNSIAHFFRFIAHSVQFSVAKGAVIFSSYKKLFFLLFVLQRGLLLLRGVN